MPAVNERRAYGHYKENRPHIASFCGTTNQPEFLNDPTGSRRWLPFTVVHIDDPYTHPVDEESPQCRQGGACLAEGGIRAGSRGGKEGVSGGDVYHRRGEP